MSDATFDIFFSGWFPISSVTQVAALAKEEAGDQPGVFCGVGSVDDGR